MSGNTNNLFWVICGAVVVTAFFLLISDTKANALTNTFAKMNSYFQSATKDNQEENTDENNQEENPSEIEEEKKIPENTAEEQRIIDELYATYTAKGWKIIDIAVEKGVACIGFNFSKNGNNSYQWQILVINTNNYEVHLKNLKWTYFDSNTHEVLLTLSPYEWQLGPNGMIMSGTANSVPMASIDHYIVFTWGD